MNIETLNKANKLSAQIARIKTFLSRANKGFSLHDRSEYGEIVIHSELLNDDFKIKIIDLLEKEFNLLQEEFDNL